MPRIRLVLPLFLTLACALALYLLQPRAVQSQAGGWYYYVQPGDTLFLIARKVGLTTNDLRSANGLASDFLRSNERLFIPTVTAPAPQSYGRGSNDAELLAHLITAEATGEPYTGQVAVGAVVLNRVQHPLFPKSVAGVIYEPDAFESVTNGLFWNPPSNQARQAAENALSGWDPSGGAIFFFNPGKTNSPFIWSRQIITQIGSHIFSR
ncbi:MAG: cell wall hydrolase [Patescibacteria group bacterium]